MGLFDFMLSPSRKCEKDILRRLEAFAKDLKTTLPHIVAKDQTEEVVMPMLIETAIDSAHKTLMEDRSSQIQYSIPDNIYENLISKAIFKVYTKHFPKWSKLIEVHSNKDLEESIQQIDNEIAEFKRKPLRLNELYGNLDKVNTLLQNTNLPLVYIRQNGSRRLSKEVSSKVALLAMNKIVDVVNEYEHFLGLTTSFSSGPNHSILMGFQSILERSWDTMSLIYRMDVSSEFWQHYIQTREKLYRKRQMISEIHKNIRY